MSSPVKCDKCGRSPRGDREQFRECRWTTDAEDTTIPVGWVCPECDRAGGVDR